MRFYSMFAGIGGFDLGLEQAGHECIGACESNPVAAGIYSRHWPGVKIDRDARTVDPDALPRFDLLAAGFPCQPFSLGGKRGGMGDARGLLFVEALRVARSASVPYVLLENVPGLLSNSNGKAFHAILKTMDEFWYDAEWQCINGRRFLPQNRKRLFIVGRLRRVPTRQVLPIAGDGEDAQDPQGEAKGEGERLRDNDVCGTIAASYWRGQTPLIEESGGRLRMLSCTEVERLQGFPDGWTEYGADGERVARTNRYACLGNAVMVPVAKFLGERLMEADLAA